MNTRQKLWLLLSALAVLLTGAGITYAWFTNNATLSTLMKITPPDQITIVPVEADGRELTGLDLDFREGDKKDTDGTIHIYRPVCIKSTSPVHQLEVVHTTNLTKLEFKIYPTIISDGTVQRPAENVSPIDGEYKNRNESTTLAEQEFLTNYVDGDTVESHAYPLYWLAVNSAIEDKCQTGWQEVTSYPQWEPDPVTGNNKCFYYTYYYLEISWLEKSKETDLFYVMAQNIDA